MVFLFIYSIHILLSVLKFMSVNIIYKNVSFKKNFGNEVLFVDEKFSILSLKKYISVSEFAYISDLLKTNNNKKKAKIIT